jgi:hypothetical protein
MDSTVLQPSAGQTVVATSDHRRHGHDDHGRRHDHDGDSWERAILREQAAGFRQAAAAHTDTIGGIKDARAANALATAHVGEEMCEGFHGLSKELCGVGKDLTGTVHATAASTLAGVVHAGEAAAEAACQINYRIDQSSKEAALAAKEAQALLFGAEARLTNGATVNANAATVQSERIRAELGLLTATGFQQANTQAERIAAASLLEARTIASAAELRAQQLHAEAMAAAEKCCCETQKLILAQACETKALIVADGNMTRALLNSQELDRTRAALAKCEAANAAYFARGVPPVVPVGP